MANAGGVELCHAAMEGGALGSLPCGMLSAEQIREQAGEIRRRTEAPLNLNFFCHRMPAPANDSAWRELLQPYYQEFGLDEPPDSPLRRPFDEAACAAVEECRPQVVSFHFGLPDRSLQDRLQAAGAVILGCATTVDEAVWLQANGVDAVIAQGFEAGGHSGRFLDPSSEPVGLMALLPQVVDAMSVPVIAAGGIFDGRGIAAAFALGASAVQLGSAYLPCPESLLPKGLKDMLRERPTVMTNIYSGGLARAVRGRLIDELGAIREEAPPYPLAGAVAMPLFRAAVERGDYGLLPSLAGQSASKAVALPAAELTRKLAVDAVAILRRQA